MPQAVRRSQVIAMLLVVFSLISPCYVVLALSPRLKSRERTMLVPRRIHRSTTLSTRIIKVAMFHSTEPVHAWYAAAGQHAVVPTALMAGAHRSRRKDRAIARSARGGAGPAGPLAALSGPRQALFQPQLERNGFAIGTGHHPAVGVGQACPVAACHALDQQGRIQSRRQCRYLQTD